jgi:hypothetical protein
MSVTAADEALTGEARQSVWAVETHNLAERFGDDVAADDVDLEVRRGCALGYLGPNGVGQTTPIRVLLDPTRAGAARPLLNAAHLGERVDAGADGLTISLAAGSDRSVAAGAKRVLVNGGVAVYRPQVDQASSESWFLEVTTRLGAPE